MLGQVSPCRLLILPDRHERVGKVLLPLRRLEWMEPSQRRRLQPAFCGIEDHKFWTIEARLADGHCVWRGRFEDREDADAFLWAVVSGEIRYERELWRLPTPWWNPDVLEYEPTFYIFVNQVLTSGAGSGNQTYNVPADYETNGSSWETIASGGSGGLNDAGSPHTMATGAGAGGYSKQTNVALTPGGTATYNIPAGAAAVSGANTQLNGNNGAACYFNGTTLGGSSVGANGGSAGSFSNSATVNGGAGGSTTGAVGSQTQNGGRGGNITTANINAATGGGGAGGTNGDGNTGVDTGVGATTGGGSGDAGSGGAGGGPITGGNGTPGGNGTEFDGTNGSGGGGGAVNGNNNVGPFSAGSGGNYGGGGGGLRDVSATNANSSGAGIQGIVFGVYMPTFLNLLSSNKMM